jgi:hypothetical protein
MATDRKHMGAAWFLLGFLPVGIIGALTLASFETIPSERIGVEAFLFMLCIAASVISTASYAKGCRSVRRRPRWFAGMLGGVVAAGTFCASVGAFYLGLGHWTWMALMFVAPGAIGWTWPVLCTKVPALQSSN